MMPTRLMPLYPYFTVLMSRSGAPCFSRQRLAIDLVAEQRLWMHGTRSIEAHVVPVTAPSESLPSSGVESPTKSVGTPNLSRTSANRTPFQLTTRLQPSTHLSSVVISCEGRLLIAANGICRSAFPMTRTIQSGATIGLQDPPGH